MMFSQSKNSIYALKKDNYISISLNTPIVEKVIKKTVVKPAVKPVATQSVVKPKDVSVDDLFNDVWTKNIKKTKKVIKKKKVNNRRLLEIQKKSKTIDKKSVEPVIEKVDKSSAVVHSKKVEKKSTANEVNEYLAKIQALVYKNFIPPQNSQGHSVKAVIELSAIGKVMDFRILNYSENSSLNSECDKIKKRLMGVLFPANPKNSSGNYIIILTSKE